MHKISRAIVVTVISLWSSTFAMNVYADIGVICTLNQELQGIVKFSNAVEDKTIAHRTFYTGAVNQEKLIVVRSPMGKVNNAITTQILLEKYKVSSIVSIGFAGSLQDYISRGDIVGSVETIQHDIGTVKPYGFIWSAASKVAENSLDERFKHWLSQGKYKVGKLVSGDQFISSTKKRSWLANKFGALAVDTNSAAIKQVCDQNKTPCGFIRIISDKASVNARQSFDVFARDENVKSVKVLKQYLDFATR